MKDSILLAILVIIASSCTDNLNSNIFKYTIQNSSSQNVGLFVSHYEIPDFYYQIDTTFRIKPNKAISYSYYSEVIIYNSPFGFGADSASIIFDDTIIVSYLWNDTTPRNPIIIDNYSGGKVNEGLYEYYYTITEEDYENALANY